MFFITDFFIYFFSEVIDKMRDYIKEAFVNRLYWGALRKLHNEYYSNRKKAAS